MILFPIVFLLSFVVLLKQQRIYVQKLILGQINHIQTYISLTLSQKLKHPKNTFFFHPPHTRKKISRDISSFRHFEESLVLCWLCWLCKLRLIWPIQEEENQSVKVMVSYFLFFPPFFFSFFSQHTPPPPNNNTAGEGEDSPSLLRLSR